MAIYRHFNKEINWWFVDVMKNTSYNVKSSKLIIDMSPYLIFLLILDFIPVRLATLPYGLDSNVTQLLANLLTKPSVFYYFANRIF